MATIGNEQLTWLDHANRIDPDGKTPRIVEMMNKTNLILADMIVVPGNLETGHKTTIRNGIPEPTFRLINKGVKPTKSKTTAITHTAGMLEDRGEVDEELVDLADDGAGFRLSENRPHIEGISQKLAEKLFYGNQEADPEEFTGLSYFYNDPSAASGANMINGGGVGADNTSIWLVGWSDNTIHGFYPKNSKAGIQHDDKGKEPVTDSEGGKYYAYVDQYKAKLGLSVRDWRYAARICNLDVSDLATAGAEGSTAANIINLMIKAKNKMPSLDNAKFAWYCNTEVMTALELLAINKENVMLTMQTLADGKILTSFCGIPIRRCDALINTESAITFS